MQAIVSPNNADVRTVTWSATPSNVATISNTGVLTATGNGVVTVRATATDGSGVSGSTTITVSGQPLLVTSITVSGIGGATTITTPGGTLQMIAAVEPENALNKTVTWSVSPSPGIAEIDSNGLLTATGNGRVTVIATANDATGRRGTTNITISGQTITNVEAPLIRDLQMFPNPFIDILHIRGAEGSNLTVTDAAGVTVYTKKITLEYEVVRLGQLPAGVYFFRVEKEGAVRTEKIVKE